MHLAAGGGDVALVKLEIEVEMGERVVLDRACPRRAAPRIRAGARSPAARRAGKPVRAMPSARCSTGSASAGAGILVEGVAGRLHQRRSGDGAPIGRRRRSCRPAPRRHGARSTGMPSARQLAGHVEEAAEIAGEHRIGAGRGDVGGLVGHHLVGDFRIFDAERAAEAAADLGARQLLEASARRPRRSRRRGCALTPSSRRPEQAS